MMSNLGKKALIELFPSPKDVLPKLATKATSFILDKFKRKGSEQGSVKAAKKFTLFTSIEDMNDINKIVKSLEGSKLSIDNATETVKHETKKKKAGFLVL